MTDMEKIISRLQIIRTWASVGPSIEGRCLEDIVRWLDDALALLKAQEPVEPEIEVVNEIDRIYRCGNCHCAFYHRSQKYCAVCGRAVKWE